jgi:hypothetical protein
MRFTGFKRKCPFKNQYSMFTRFYERVGILITFYEFIVVSLRSCCIMGLSSLRYGRVVLWVYRRYVTVVWYYESILVTVP